MKGKKCYHSHTICLDYMDEVSVPDMTEEFDIDLPRPRLTCTVCGGIFLGTNTRGGTRAKACDQCAPGRLRAMELIREKRKTDKIRSGE